MATSRPDRAPVLGCRVVESGLTGSGAGPPKKRKKKKRKEKEKVMTDMAVTASSALITESTPGETAPANSRSLALRSWRKLKKIVRHLSKTRF
jgi:hypothetical protein